MPVIDVPEEAFAFQCEGDDLVGVLAAPHSASPVGVVIIVGGPQYRVGSHRQFVLLARRLANGGFPVLRFDYRGMGDSAGMRRDFEAVGADVKAAVDALVSRCPSVESIVLWGLCDAASAALLYAPGDRRVRGLVLANPWAREAQSYARVQLKHYYLRRLVSADFWRKLLSARLSVSNTVAELRQKIMQASRKTTDQGDYRRRMLTGFRKFDGAILLFISGQDLTAQEFVLFMSSVPDGAKLLGEARVRRIELPRADHTFSQSPWQEAVEEATLGWLRAIQGGQAKTQKPTAFVDQRS